MSNFLSLSYPEIKPFNHHLNICGSKSETNRLLLLNALFDNAINLKNISDSDDSHLMINALANSANLIDIHHAGTAMRFLTAYFACQENRILTLTGSARMKERPIKVLVDALIHLGAEIEYDEKDGYPPIRISGKKIKGGRVVVPASTSSQYLTALLLMAPTMTNGLDLQLDGEITSRPYLEMTTNLLLKFGVNVSWKENVINVFPKESIRPKTHYIESDWSSASYHYSMVAIAGGEISLSTYKKDSLQGDSALVGIYEKYFGVKTTFLHNKITLKKERGVSVNEKIELNLNDCPDIAQTVACTCAGLGVNADLYGLATLKIKETDRLLALKNELFKLGVNVVTSTDSLHIQSYEKAQKEQIVINTYNDHRMAMSFAPLAIHRKITFENPSVVNKSYPKFWLDLIQLGFLTDF